MKRYRRLPLIVSFGMAITTVLYAQTPPPLRILPLGDEFTYGQGVAGGYRFPLYQSLTNAGFNVDFVGTRTDNGAAGLPDSNHQGQVSNWRISGGTQGLDETLYQWLNVIDDPDVVLLHIGANDTNSTGTAISRLNNLISRIATNRPSAHIIVTTLLPRGDSYSNYVTETFNPYVASTVSDQQTLGRKVHYLDMYSCLTLDDLTGTPARYPDAEGYAKMAAAWFTAITNIVTPCGDTSAPALSRALGAASLDRVTVTFTKALNPATATNLANYAIDGGLSLTAASLSSDQRKVTLTTTLQTKDTVYTLTVNNITDLTPSPGPVTIAAGSMISFRAVCRGYLANVPESSDYFLAYALDLPGNAKYGRGAVGYSTDNSQLLQGLPLDRIAYYVELQTPNTPLTYLWISMDAFTGDITKIGVPTLSTGVSTNLYLSNLTIQCNDPAIVTGSGLSGNLEFWPSNYSATHMLGFEGASDSAFDFDDTATPGTYGSMQIHNFAARQTLFSFSNWGTESANGATPDIGIGNCPYPRNSGYDWTFSNDAYMYSIRTLQILVKRAATADTVPPAVVSAQAGFAGNLVQVVFSEPLAADSVRSGDFSFDKGVEILSVRLLPDSCTVNLTTTPQPAGTVLTLRVSGIHDRVGGNAIAADTTVTVATPDTLPAEIAANAGALADGYRLVYTLEIPVKGVFNSTNDPYSFNQSCATGAFDRIAYYIELRKSPSETPQYLWVSMDAFTPYLSKIGVPTKASQAVFQQIVDHLDVKSNVSGISNGTAMTGGNLEFWPYNYSQTNAADVAGASNATYDFGDRMDPGGHGSMQIHNYAAAQTLFAMNDWGTDNNLIALGIGNCPSSLSSNPDWTFADNAGSYSRRILHVLVRPCTPTAANLPEEVAANVPGAAGYQHLYTIDIPLQGCFNSNAVAEACYLVNNSADAGCFSRVAYYLELQTGSEAAQWIWTAMDAFTTDVSRLGIPTNNCVFQQIVDHLEVRSNVGGIVTGSEIETGNIEFWPYNYSAANALSIPNASGDTYDFGDVCSYSADYGCMQVHNYGASQTLFAINRFNNYSQGGDNKVCIGIGNRPDSSWTDWTHANNAADYDVRRLYVFVLPGGSAAQSDSTRPALSRAMGSTSLRRVNVYFSEPVADSAADPAHFAIDGGLQITGAVMLPAHSNSTVQLTTSLQTAGQAYTVTVSGVRDRSGAANLITAGSTVSFTAQTEALPDFLGVVPEAAGFSLIQKLAVGNKVSYASGADYLVDESYPQTQSIDRVAYCMELAANDVTKWVYVSMDAFTEDVFHIGVPTGDRDARFQQYVSNLNIYASSNIANVDVATGTGIPAGNIEFWPNNYGATNAKGIPNASGSTYDFGDSIDTYTTIGHGSMQIHNFAQSQTIFSMCSFGSNNRTPCLGIGNRSGAGISDPDWTFANNAGDYSTKNIYVLVHWGAPPTGVRTGTTPSILTQPAGATLHARDAFSIAVQAIDATRYQWRHNGAPIPGATFSYLEIPSASVNDGGVYDVIIFGSGFASATSASATLEVIADGTVLRLR